MVTPIKVRDADTTQDRTLFLARLTLSITEIHPLGPWIGLVVTRAHPLHH